LKTGIDKNEEYSAAPLVKQIPLTEKKAIREFVLLEKEFLSSYPFFLADMTSETTKRLSGQSPFYSEMNYALFVVSDGSSEKARCAAFINRKYQRAKNEAVGFIGYFAAMPEAESEVTALLEEAEKWLRKHNVTRVIAPYNGTLLHGMGLLTAEFDMEPVFPFSWHPPYYRPYLEDAGYQPTYPLWFYRIDFSSEKYRAVEQKVLENKAVTIRPIDKKNWDEDLEKYRKVLNQTLKEEWEYCPLTREEFSSNFGAMKSILDPRLMLVAEIDGEAAGVCMGFPDWGPLLRSFKGKFGIVQLIKLMFGVGRYDRAGLTWIGVLPGFRGKGVAQSLTITLYRRFQEKGLKEASYMCVNESNLASRRFAEVMGGTGRSRYHCYDKTL
jgi:GNAT superfamily N-acetyltransferase